MITFKFTPNKDDYIKGMRAYYIHQKSTWITTALLGLLFVINFLLFAFSGQADNPVSLVFVFIFVFYLLFLLVINPLMVGRQVQLNERLRVEVTWTVSDEGIQVVTPHAESKSDWGTYYDFFETKEHFLIRLSANKRMFQIVAKRAFASEGEMAAFRRLLETNIAKARRAAPRTSWLARNGFNLLLYLSIAIFLIILFVYSFMQAAGG